MKYLPIFQELFESDSFIFMIFGIVMGVFAGLRLMKRQKLVPAALISAIIYGVCEILSNIHTTFLLELILMFIGTMAIGCCIGFLLCFLIRSLNRQS